jgi:hypothetical protein
MQRITDETDNFRLSLGWQSGNNLDYQAVAEINFRLGRKNEAARRRTLRVR